MMKPSAPLSAVHRSRSTMSKIKWSPNLNMPCWVLALERLCQLISHEAEIRSISGRQAVRPSCRQRVCLTVLLFGGHVRCATVFVQRTQLFPEDCSAPESFSRTPMPPEKPTLHLGAGQLSQVPLLW